jgi:hypothetical protein
MCVFIDDHMQSHFSSMVIGLSLSPPFIRSYSLHERKRQDGYNIMNLLDKNFVLSAKSISEAAMYVNII